MADEKLLLDADAIQRGLTRIAHEIAEANPNSKSGNYFSANFKGKSSATFFSFMIFIFFFIKIIYFFF